MTSGHVLFSEQLSTVFHFLFSFVLSFSLFLGTSRLWMGWQHSCSSSFHSFKTCWLVTMAVFSLSQLYAFVELWRVSIVVYFLRCYLKSFHRNLFPFTLPVSLLINEWGLLAHIFTNPDDWQWVGIFFVLTEILNPILCSSSIYVLFMQLFNLCIDVCENPLVGINYISLEINAGTWLRHL